MNRDAIADRCRARAEALGLGSCAVRFSDEDATGDADTLCLAGASLRQPRGRTLVASFPVETTQPLHELLSGFLPMLGRPFRPGAIFSHVGTRACSRRETGMSVSFWMKDELVTPHIRRDRILRPIAAWLATVGGVGLLPAIGANVASVLTCAAIFLAGSFADPSTIAVGVAVLSTLLSVAVEKAAERHFLSEDAREFVLDEVAGMAVALCFLPAKPHVWLFVAAFVAFRFFDILKPGIQWVEKLPIPGKVAWDDVLAGLYAGIVVSIVATVAR